MDGQHLARTARILVVDDVAVNRRLLARRLTAEGYAVETADNGVNALAKVASFAPDVVLLDVEMPQMDGLMVCRCLRADVGMRGLPVVFVTALEDAAAQRECLAAGGDAVLPKDVEAVTLLACVRSLLSRAAVS